MVEMASLEYTVDSNGILTSVSAGWDEFARQNDGHDRVFAADVLGRPLLHFIAGGTFKHLWATVMERVAASGHSVRLPYRCDAPGLIRRMELLIECAPAGALRFVSTVLETTDRPAGTVLAATVGRDHERMLWICSWCKRLEAQERWVEVHEAACEFGLFERDEVPDITHGLCPECERKILAELERATPGGTVSAAGVDRGRFDLL